WGNALARKMSSLNKHLRGYSVIWTTIMYYTKQQKHLYMVICAQRIIKENGNRSTKIEKEVELLVNMGSVPQWNRSTMQKNRGVYVCGIIIRFRSNYPSASSQKKKTYRTFNSHFFSTWSKF